MVGSTLIAVAAVSVGILTCFLTCLYFYRWRRRERLLTKNKDELENSQPGFELESKRRLSNLVCSRGVSPKPLFNWDNNPSLINDAVENGWSQFAFAAYISSSPSSRSRLLGLCTVAEIEKEIAAEISWEVSQGSADFMQKIRFNSGIKRMINHPISSSSSSPLASSIVKTALPLPGPPLSSFPQESYFEITVLLIAGDENDGTVKEGERIKLIAENHHNSKMNSESLVYFTSNNKVSNVEESKLNGKNEDEDGKSEDVMLSVGLTSGGSTSDKLPGSYPGSIGFNSNGSVFLDGIKLVFESEKEEWGRAEKVIGCGFDPKQKKVYFTVDSELVHIIHCKSEEFGSPMYPILAANEDVTVLVNLGQSAFKYAAAQRTSNPCFVSRLVNATDGDGDGGGGSNGNGYEDSRELFSMGMIDSQWFHRPTPVGNNNNVVVVDHQEMDFVDDDESSDEIELFEIVVEDSRQIVS